MPTGVYEHNLKGAHKEKLRSSRSTLDTETDSKVGSWHPKEHGHPRTKFFPTSSASIWITRIKPGAEGNRKRNSKTSSVKCSQFSSFTFARWTYSLNMWRTVSSNAFHHSWILKPLRLTVTYQSYHLANFIIFISITPGWTRNSELKISQAVQDIFLQFDPSLRRFGWIACCLCHMQRQRRHIRRSDTSAIRRDHEIPT